MKVLDTICEFDTVFVCVLVCSAEAVTILQSIVEFIKPFLEL